MRLVYVVVVLLGLISLCLLGVVLQTTSVRPISQDTLSPLQIYAYRDWQSTTYTLNPGDLFEIQASGEWLYSPQVSYHGPEGSKYHQSPSSYPLPFVAGGALIGRIGDNGPPFYVGRHTATQADRFGNLYLRIDDDHLGDNDGVLTVEITIAATPTPQADMVATALPSR